MATAGVGAGLALIALALWDGFETMVLPRRVTRLLHLSRLFHRGTWWLWRLAARGWPHGKRREAFLSLYGPLSLLSLLAAWAGGLIVGFALLYHGLGLRLQTPAGEALDFPDCLYLSGVTFFTLGYGDFTPTTPAGRALAVVEAGLGFGFMAVVIGYLPVLYGAFSRREASIALLDARAGSPPSAAQLLLRLGHARHVAAVEPLLAEWERWSAELLESHLSFPLLSYYRSQHDNQSWLAALTAVLDSCSFLLAGVRGVDPYQAQLTFAMARHAAVDIALVFLIPPREPDPDRLPPEKLHALRGQLRGAGLELADGPEADARLRALRAMYEPFVQALADRLLFPLPPFVPDKPAVDNWQTSAWARRVPGFGKLHARAPGDDHFD